MHCVVPTYWLLYLLLYMETPYKRYFHKLFLSRFQKFTRNLQITFFVIFENIKSLIKRIHFQSVEEIKLKTAKLLRRFLTVLPISNNSRGGLNSL